MANNIDSQYYQYYLNSLLGQGSGTSASSSTSASNTMSSFSQLLSSYMSASTASLLGDFSGTGSTSSSYMDMLGSSLYGSSGLSGSSGSSGSSNMLLMLMMMMLLQNQQNSTAAAVTNANTNASTNTSSMLNAYTNMNRNHVYAYPSSSGLLPSNGALAATPAITSKVGLRNAGTYRTVLNQFDVENTQRYSVKGDNTYCNIFVWDATKAMGAEIPHYINTQTGAPAQMGDEYSREQSANQVNDWLNTYGKAYGWTKVTAEEAQQYANMGMPAVTSWKNPSGHGHLQMVSPSLDGGYDATRGVAIAQAGNQLINYGYITDSYDAETLPQVEYFVHA